jgi:hypothetical protein
VVFRVCAGDVNRNMSIDRKTSTSIPHMFTLVPVSVSTGLVQNSVGHLRREVDAMEGLHELD